jgi:putative membrane protein
MKIAVMAGALAFSAFATPSFAQTPMPASDFAMKASVGNTFEVEESKLALKQAKSPKLKAFAKMMISDHSLAEKKLTTAAKSSGTAVEMKLDDPHQSMVTALSSKSGADFDKAYTADQVQAHQETASLLTDYQGSGDDAKLKTWAKMTLPKVQMHLKRIQAISSTMTSSM